MDALHPLPHPSVLAHVVDAHCHPTDSPLSPAVLSGLPHRICAMATRASDQPLVRSLAEQFPDKVIPCFGYHPWFIHWISLAPPNALPAKDVHYQTLLLPLSEPEHAPLLPAFHRLLPLLPDPVSLATIVEDLRTNLSAFPHAMLGEVGLDRAFRIPFERPAVPPYASSPAPSHPPGHSHDAPEPRRELSPFTTPLAHQVAVLEAQLALAVVLRRNVSMHAVKAQQATLALLARMRAAHGSAWTALSVDMHSCGLSALGWAEIERVHPNVFLSLSTAINARSPAHVALLRAVHPARLLVESDFHDVAYSAACTWDMLARAATARGWWLEESGAEVEAGRMLRAGHGDDGQAMAKAEEGWGAVRRIAENWRVFERGGHTVLPGVKKKRDKKKLLLDSSEEESGGE
ncbi:uncharacterized protein FIBRA_02054 [Fibroporia radiculosa]|uniref:Metallo-dependent hydrolase n=1 Tax=Fibroporia radiculosa TaxID=599839 RepID=J4G1B8_9APHY|nr:uncharacterized protein FIBRA_02054 [Fibroporia radiculosa]CCM00028.1 predicted protein [Fibroporia radiculosa]